MSKTKKQSRTKNLGHLARKRPRSVASDDEQITKHQQTASPGPEPNDGSDSGRSDPESEPEIMGPDIDHNSDSGEDDGPGAEIYKEDDVPHPKDSADLANWLKIRQGISTRRAQELRKAEKQDTDITLKFRDLLGVAPDVRDESRVELTKVRQPIPLKIRQELAQINEEFALRLLWMKETGV
ncbi:hypothetical protein B0H14DRAFT_3754789 [Mycena olivaceomarginata]|nr:hypothetical protein B0H14DRAFT_3754789 [Mycena olivaceomarginata]